MATRATPAVRWLARLACWSFYRTDCVGAVPEHGTVILLPNHPNALLDPAVVWATAGRDVRFLAKSTLFDGAFGIVLRAAGAIPVYRKIDQGVDTSKNAEMFAAVSKALAAGDAICLFPEGISHSTGRLEPLRTGAARMALAAERNGTSVALVPVGLNFDRKTVFRSRVTIVFGPAFSSGDLVAGSPDLDADDGAAVRALTERIAAHMRRLLIEADPHADAALVERVDRLYRAARARQNDPAERVERRRAIAAGIERLRAADPERYEQILLRLRRYDQRLRRFRLRDQHLDWRISSRDTVIFAIRELALGILLLPLCVVGLAVFFLPYQLTGIVADRITPKRDVIATAQVFVGAAIHAVWLLAIGTAIWWLTTRRLALAVMVALLCLAFASLRAIERESAVIDAVRAWWFLRRARRDTRERLRRRRSELADILDDVNRWLNVEADAGATAVEVGVRGQS
jgi:1-acyl-sn-glycerol-3-phosphate acyltransferase